MINFTLICGLPGSGKTTLANYLANQTPNSLVIDDPSINGIPTILDLKDYDHVFIADPAFCRRHTRLDAVLLLTNMFSDAKINYIFFENNPEQCIKNSKKRLESEPAKKVESYIRYLSERYFHHDDTVYPVFSDDQGEKE